MFPWNIGFWWCCLNPREQGVLRATIMGIVETVNVGIPVPIWLAFWLPYPDASDEVRAAFLDIYRLRIVTIEVGEPPLPVDVVQAYEGLDYAAWAVFLLTTEAACSGGCEQSSVP